jgi:hypothetical protein
MYEYLCTLSAMLHLTQSLSQLHHLNLICVDILILNKDPERKRRKKPSQAKQIYTRETKHSSSFPALPFPELKPTPATKATFTMATRRIVNTEKTVLDQDDHNEEKSNISPAVPK